VAVREPHDEIRYCERCGISFLWSQEEQKSAAPGAPPLYCPGCQVLLPTATRARGLVKWYNGRKRYGFIVRQDQPELFVHGSDVAEGARLQPGDLVEFSVATGARGPMAREVHILGHGDAPPE
jgi:CspA family cold shock protein